jgi:membrane-bound inhibitor of C-type lysozyme
MSGAGARRDPWPRRAVRAVPVALCAAAAIVAVGCLPRVQREEAVDITTVYSCVGDSRFSVRELGRVATVRLGMQTIALPRARTASGVRYAADGQEFWNRGPMATLRVGGETLTDCRGELAATPWDESRLLGIEYRAAGSEPTWSLEIDDGKYIRFIPAGGSAVYWPAPQPTRDSTRLVYQAVSNSRVLEALIEQTPCVNASSRDPFPHSVKVTVDGFPYRGCGRPLGSP